MTIAEVAEIPTTTLTTITIAELTMTMREIQFLPITMTSPAKTARSTTKRKIATTPATTHAVPTVKKIVAITGTVDANPETAETTGIAVDMEAVEVVDVDTEAVGAVAAVLATTEATEATVDVVHAGEDVDPVATDTELRLLNSKEDSDTGGGRDFKDPKEKIPEKRIFKNPWEKVLRKNS